MPRPKIGQIVHWYQDMNVRRDPDWLPIAAIVTDIGSDQIRCSLAVPGSFTFDVREGVRHVTDPDKAKIKATDAGVWDFIVSPNKGD